MEKILYPVSRRYMNIDIETYATYKLQDVGVYKYIDDKHFEVMLIGYKVDGGKTRIIDLMQPEADTELELEAFRAMLYDDSIEKRAYNAQFERVCLSRHFNSRLMPDTFIDTMVDAARFGAPFALAGAAEVFGSEKDAAGDALIRYFSMPCKPTKANGKRTRNLPEHDMEKWEQFKAYCIQDVEAEHTIHQRAARVQNTDTELNMQFLDQEINDSGIYLDTQFIEQAIALDEQTTEKEIETLKALTGLENPNSNVQLLGWLQSHDPTIENVQRATLEKLVDREDVVGQVARIKINIAKSSVTKYVKMKDMTNRDSRLRGAFRFIGASRTGRWASRGLNFQNFSKATMPEDRLLKARALVRAGDFETLQKTFDEHPKDLLSQLLRSAIMAPDAAASPEGTPKKLIVCDFSAIEARVIAWFAEEDWRMDVFRTHGKIYEASAAQMFDLPIERCEKGTPEGEANRAKGKVAELALGYQGSVGAINQMAGEGAFTESEARKLVSDWRAANTGITEFWANAERAARDAIEAKAPTLVSNDSLEAQMDMVYRTNKLEFNIEPIWDDPRLNALTITLPSGRKLYYANPEIKPSKRNPQYTNINFHALRAGKFREQDTYGGKLVENIVQATARDVLVESLLRIRAAYDPSRARIISHVHDEIILETDLDVTVEEIEDLMSQPVDWAPDLPLAADGFETTYYKKD